MVGASHAWTRRNNANYGIKALANEMGRGSLVGKRQTEKPGAI